MGLAAIVGAMEQKAEEMIATVTSAAERESLAIIAEAEEDAKRIKEKHRAAADERLKTSRARILGDAALDCRRQLAAAREAWFARVLARSQQQLSTLRDAPGYAEGLERLAGEAFAEIGAKVMLEIAPQDEESMRRIMSTLAVQ
ncbi:MAG: V-type ATP synthase subunit E family protein, partial [Deltaproteobacteria bacterium]|nr:V-type ATP synthase subunit E family protein [Deltaproteobacteria bacterium]